MSIFAIDPGNIQSAYIIVDKDNVPKEKGKIDNCDLRNLMLERFVYNHSPVDYVGIEMIKSYGMRVGQTVFDTCRWVGIFEEILSYSHFVHLVGRADVKKNLCGNIAGANDTAVNMVLRDRFTPGNPRPKGTKKNPGFFYEFNNDIYAAFAVAVTMNDAIKNGTLHEIDSQWVR